MIMFNLFLPELISTTKKGRWRSQARSLNPAGWGGNTRPAILEFIDKKAFSASSSSMENTMGLSLRFTFIKNKLSLSAHPRLQSPDGTKFPLILLKG